MSFSSVRSLRALLLLVAPSILLAGCGLGTVAGPSGSTIEFARGVVHGGQSAIQNATVKLYHTDATATTYGAPGVLIGSGTSDANGSFTIGTSATTTNCPAGTQAYITAAGGYQTSKPTLINNNMLMIAALGDCSGVSASTLVTINEVTSVAAAYALSGFMTTGLDGSNSFYTANVSAPVANSTSVNSITPTTPAGLAHAFLNASKLVDTVGGLPNTTTTVSTAGTTTTGNIPVSEILTIADMMQSCVDSASGNNGSVSAIPVTAGGSGYGPTITISGSGTGATANAVVSGGVVTGLTLTNAGSGYAPTVAVTQGTGAVIAPVLSAGAVTSYTLSNYGSGYGATVTFTGGGGSGATAAVTSAAGVPSAYVVTNGGSGYTSAPTVTIGGGGTGATATATVSGGAVTKVTLVAAGSGYGPAVTVAAPTSGTTATATATVVGGQLTGLTIVAAGSGYGPTVAINGTTGSGATATASVSGGVVTGLNVTAGGTGYPSPTVTVAAPTTGTTATASATTTGGVITGISVTNSGSGYTAAPAVTITGAGSGATATATVFQDANNDNLAPSSLCNTLFAMTPSITGVRPTNSLQPFINLARNPYPSAAAMNATSGLLSLASATSAFQPILTAAPVDWSISIVYNTGLAAPYWISLDANDTVYVGLSTTSTSLPALYGIGSYGVSVPTFGSMTSGTTTRGIAPDALGNIWIDNNSTGLYRFSTSSGGTPTAYTTLSSSYGLAVDVNNNLWAGHVIATGSNMDEFSYNSKTSTWVSNFTASHPGGVYNVSVDANQNIWAAAYYTTGSSGSSNYGSVLVNSGTPSSTNYNPAGTVVTPVTTVLSGGATHPYAAVFDAAGNAWYDIYGVSSLSTSGIMEVAPNSPTAITSLTPGSFITGNTPGTNGNVLGSAVTNIASIDGAGTMFIADNTTSYGIHIYSTVNGSVLSPALGIKSCLLTTSSPTACGTAANSAIYNTRQTVVDSTGSVWAGITSGGVTQIIGVAAPSYPLLSTGKPGLSPGLTTVNPLP